VSAINAVTTIRGFRRLGDHPGGGGEADAPFRRGISFEDFELHEPFQSGQTVVFGVIQKDGEGSNPG